MLVRVSLLLLTLSGCSAISAASSMLGGGSGTSVAANVQAGQTNSQTLGVTNNTDQDVKLRDNSGTVNQDNSEAEVKTGKVDSLTINNADPLLIILLILGWLLPSPQEMWRGLSSFFKRKEVGGN